MKRNGAFPRSARYIDMTDLRTSRWPVTPGEVELTERAFLDWPGGLFPPSLDGPINPLVLTGLLRFHEIERGGIYSKWLSTAPRMFAQTGEFLGDQFYRMKRANIVRLTRKRPPNYPYQEHCVCLTADARAFVREKGLIRG